MKRFAPSPIWRFLSGTIMKRLMAIILAGLGFAGTSYAQFTNVTVSPVKDPSGSPYVGCRANANFVPSPTATTQPLINGSVFPTSIVLAQCDSFGNAAWTLVDNNQVSDGHGGGPVSQWQFNITSQDGKTAFACLITITGATQNITSAIQACAAPLPATGGGGGNFVVKNVPCASSMTFTMAGVSPNTSNTAFFVNPLNCNVTSSVVAPPTGGAIQQGAIAQFTLINSGGFSFAWPANFVDTPTIQSTGTTSASFWYDGTKWHCQTCPASGGGGGGSPSGPAGTIQSTNGSSFSSSNISEPIVGPLSGSLDVNEDQGNKGPNPYVDIRNYGARACNPAATPCALGLTATINSGSTIATISNASTFVNGDGVVCYGCGPLNSLSTPAAPTVTNVLAAGGTGTGVVSASAAGSTTKCYKIVARDPMGGVTAASSETCTTTGQPTLGAVSVSVTSFSRSGTTVTVTTSSAHPVLVGTGGGEVFITGASDPSFDGWYPVASAADTTHFTWTNTVASTVNGSPASATGGTATFYPANHVTWTGVAGAWVYYIYCGASGAETLCGVSNLEGTNTDDTWDDFANLQTNWTFPPFIPTTPPTSATADNLSTTIVSGGGTTTLTLATAASTSVSGATIRLDAAPGIIAAAQVFGATGSAGTLFIPVDPSGNSFVVNSFLDLRTINSQGTSIVQYGTLVLNDTIAFKNVRWSGYVSAQMTGGGPGSWSAGKPTIEIENGARPGVYISNSGGQGPDLRLLNFQCFNINGCLNVLVEGGFSMNFDTVDFGTGGTSNDLMGIGLYLRGSAGQSAASVVLDKVAFAAGNTSDGTSHNATLYCNLCGDMHVREAYSVHRGMIYSAPSAGGTLQIDNWHINGGGTPFLSMVGGVSNNYAVDLGQILMDTIAHPCVAVLGTSTVIQMDVGCAPSGGVTAITGGSITGVVGPGSISQGINTLIGLGQVVGPTNSGVETVWTKNDGPISVSSSLGSIYVAGATPAIPTVALLSGGSLTPGVAYQFVVVPVWANGIEGNPSPPSVAATPTSGTQTIQVTGTALSNPSPVCYNIYISENNGGFGLPSVTSCLSSPFITLTSFSFFSKILGAVVQGGPTMLMPGAGGIATPSLTLNNTTPLTGVQGTDTNVLSSGVATGVAGSVLCLDTNKGATTVGCSSGLLVQTNSTNNASQSTLNFITSTANSIGATITPSNPSTNQEKFELTGIINPAGGGCGVSNPAAHSLLITEGSSNCNPLTSPTGPGNFVVSFNSTGSQVDPIASLAGVCVNSQGGSYVLAYSDRACELPFTGTSSATFTIPVHTTAGFGSNFPFVVPNNGTATLTISPTTDTIDFASVFPNWAHYIYENSTGNFNSVRVPMFAAFPSCSGASNALTFTPSTGSFGCNSISGGGSALWNTVGAASASNTPTNNGNFEITIENTLTGSTPGWLHTEASGSPSTCSLSANCALLASETIASSTAEAFDFLGTVPPSSNNPVWQIPYLGTMATAPGNAASSGTNYGGPGQSIDIVLGAAGSPSGTPWTTFTNRQPAFELYHNGTVIFDGGPGTVASGSGGNQPGSLWGGQQNSPGILLRSSTATTSTAHQEAPPIGWTGTYYDIDSVQTFSIGSGGTGYSATSNNGLGDLVYLACAATWRVTSVSSGVVTGLTFYAPRGISWQGGIQPTGTGCTVANGQATTTSGSGTGLTINVLTIGGPSEFTAVLRAVPCFQQSTGATSGQVQYGSSTNNDSICFSMGATFSGTTAGFGNQPSNNVGIESLVIGQGTLGGNTMIENANNEWTLFLAADQPFVELATAYVAEIMDDNGLMAWGPCVGPSVSCLPNSGFEGSGMNPTVGLDVDADSLGFSNSGGTGLVVTFWKNGSGATIPDGQPVKACTGTASTICPTSTTDGTNATPGLVIGVVDSAGSSFFTCSSNALCKVATTGRDRISIKYDGTSGHSCSIGNFVIMGTTGSGGLSEAMCTSTYTAGTVIGVAMAAQSSTGGFIDTMIGLR